MTTATRAEAGPLPIVAGTCYALPHFMRAVGLGRHGLREARRAGLKVRRLHGRAYILGEDWLEYVRAAAAE